MGRASKRSNQKQNRNRNQNENPIINPNPNQVPIPNPNQDATSSNQADVEFGIHLDTTKDLSIIRMAIDSLVSFGQYTVAYDALKTAASNCSDQDDESLGYIQEMFMLVANASGETAMASKHCSNAINLYQKAARYPDGIRYVLTCLLGGKIEAKDSRYEDSVLLLKHGLKLNPSDIEKNELRESMANILSIMVKARDADERKKELIESEEREKERKLEGNKKKNISVVVPQPDVDPPLSQYSSDSDPDADPSPEPVPVPVPQSQPLEFQKTYSMILDTLDRGVSVTDHLGTYGMYLISNIQASTIPDTERLSTFTDLALLCASNNYLLTIFHVIQHPRDGFDALLVEDCMTFDEFCQHLEVEFNNLEDRSKQNWWRYIENIFMSLSRDVIEGLKYLYKERGRCCGNLVRSVYITRQRQSILGTLYTAKIMPCLGVGYNKENDMHGLTSLMRKLLLYPFPSSTLEDSGFGFPEDLISFFTFDSENKNLPVEYRFSHPCFWNKSEKLNFPEFLKTVLFRSQARMQSLDDFLVINSLFEKWSERLFGNQLYEAIWEQGNPLKVRTKEELDMIESLDAFTVTPYATPVTIVRYFGDAIHHSNSIKYAALRDNKLLSCTEVVSDLFAIYPEFNVVMFESVGRCISRGMNLDRDILEEIWSKK